jgi:class 3 adenylate cyclase
VLASDQVADAVADDGLMFEQIGPVELKGLSRPVTLYRVTRP